MRHAYVGDVGDFGKYGLLRALHRHDPSKRLGIVWYLTAEYEPNNDGKHDGYLKSGSTRYRESFRRCDEELYAELLRIRGCRRLNIGLIEQSPVLPASTCYYNCPIPFAKARIALSHQWKERNQWHAEALLAVHAADYVFTDPDNGVVFPFPESTITLDRPYHVRPSRKHSYWDELVAYLERGKSVVAYHHLGRQRGGHVKQIHSCLDQIRLLGRNALALHYRRGSARAFLIIPASDEHCSWLRDASREFAQVWAAHCDLIWLPRPSNTERHSKSATRSRSSIARK
jgi:hypothetical protein